MEVSWVILSPPLDIFYVIRAQSIETCGLQTPPCEISCNSKLFCCAYTYLHTRFITHDLVVSQPIAPLSTKTFTRESEKGRIGGSAEESGRNIAGKNQDSSLKGGYTQPI